MTRRVFDSRAPAPALRALVACSSFVVLAALGCGSSSHASGGPDAGTDSMLSPDGAAGEGSSPPSDATTDAPAVAYDGSVAPTGFPPVPRIGSGVFSSFRLVSIVPANYGTPADEATLDSWGDYVVTSSWLKTVVSEYGAPTTGTSAHLSGPAITETTYTAPLVRQYVSTVVASDAGAAYAPDGHTVYVLYLPPTTTVGEPVCATHFDLDTLGDAVGLVLNCALPGLTTLESAIVGAGHELVESLTDTPLGGGYALTAPPSPPALTPWAWSESSSGTPHSELADLCHDARWTESGFPFTRIWSNQAAAAGGDPCIPAVTQPYYSVQTTSSWVMASPGETVTIPLSGWTKGGTTTDWELEAAEAADSAQSASNSATMTTPTLASATTTTLAGTTYPTINDGRTATLTVPLPPSASHGAWVVVEVRSEHLSDTGASTLDPDVRHSWFVGVYVP